MLKFRPQPHGTPGQAGVLTQSGPVEQLARVLLLTPLAVLKPFVSRFFAPGWAGLLLWLLVLGGAPGCNSDSPNPSVTTTPTAPPPVAPAAPVLVGSTLIGEYTPAQLADRVSDIPLAGSLARYSVKVYRLTYTTRNTDGQAVTASGALLVPVAPAAVPVISYQHGTLQPDEENRAPSYYSQRSEIWSAVSVLASTGYVVSAPDYIGYGASKALPHPYEHAASLASASADMLRAAREFCAKEKVSVNQKNFLLGYSEGGYATMALHKLLEEKYATELPVTASAPGAGAYHKSAFARYIMGSTQPLNFLSTYVWVLRTYDRVYKLNRPFSYYYQEPYATRLQADPFSAVPQPAGRAVRPRFPPGRAHRFRCAPHGHPAQQRYPRLAPPGPGGPLPRHPGRLRALLQLPGRLQRHARPWRHESRAAPDSGRYPLHLGRPLHPVSLRVHLAVLRVKWLKLR